MGLDWAGKSFSTAQEIQMTTSTAVSLRQVTGDLHQLLREAAKDTPRFLFRKSTSTSGGDARLNTVDKITPRALLDLEDGLQSIDDFREDKLVALWNLHYRGKDVDTPFSSWSASQKYVLSMASDVTGFASMAAHAVGPPHDALISVLDTTKLGAKHLAVWTSHPLVKARRDLEGRDNEFLVFGVVQGAAHSAVKATILWQNGLPQLYPKVDHRPSPQQQIFIATHIAALFGQDFALPITCYLLARRPYGPIPTSYATWQDLHSELVPLLVRHFGIQDGQLYDVGAQFTNLMAQSSDVAEALNLLTTVTSGAGRIDTNERNDNLVPGSSASR
ncbi:hypothetical protein LTR86_004327 [Recurvomyces mirabilis]|nr:hypothetical protein LTR86_004327 [Recurvomyces mirabilis]